MSVMTAVGNKERNLNPYFVARVIVWIVLLGVLLGYAAPALADDGIGGVVNNLVESITGIIQDIAIGAGVLGLTIFGIGKLVRPMFPQVAGLTQNYIPDLLVGVAIVFVATEIVEGIAGTIGG